MSALTYEMRGGQLAAKERQRELLPPAPSPMGAQVTFLLELLAR